MTDAELLEKAALAAGTECQWFGAELRIRRPDRLWELWSPLTDDGDALRLAVKLGIWVHPDSHTVEVVGVRAVYERIEHHEDKDSATRRAIVRAAAAMAKPRTSRPTGGA